jgi:hypothetical protein
MRALASGGNISQRILSECLTQVPDRWIPTQARFHCGLISVVPARYLPLKAKVLFHEGIRKGIGEGIQ